jgi:hypothetical protein
VGCTVAVDCSLASYEIPVTKNRLKKLARGELARGLSCGSTLRSRARSTAPRGPPLQQQSHSSVQQRCQMVLRFASSVCPGGSARVRFPQRLCGRSLSSSNGSAVGGTAHPIEGRGTFGSAAQRAPRYMGIPTFMRSPLVSIDEACASGLDVAMIGIPFDNGVTNRAGARHGPREVRVQSANMRGIHRVHQFSPFEIARVADVGDIAFENHYGLCVHHRSYHPSVRWLEFCACW